MTTNETFFFRDKVPFDHFRDAIMPEVLKARASRKSIRIWCAAGSTGQEPYSLAMSIKEMGAALAGWCRHRRRLDRRRAGVCHLSYDGRCHDRADAE